MLTSVPNGASAPSRFRSAISPARLALDARETRDERLRVEKPASDLEIPAGAPGRERPEGRAARPIPVGGAVAP